ncbi:MAG: PilZ domain-containing protein [Deltaproteobacteria bacterium]|nr:PilZ domain-containing protein [Deltaproteobacteria bacterium]
MGDRRDSPRIPLVLWVRMIDAGGSFEEKKGDVGVGGAFFEDRFPPVGTAVQLRFRLPGTSDEIRCEGEILRTTDQAGTFGAHVRFVDIPTDAELAIAKFIDDHELGKDA